MARGGAARDDQDGSGEPDDRRRPVAPVHALEPYRSRQQRREDRRGRGEEGCVRGARVREGQHERDLAQGDAEHRGDEEQPYVGPTKPDRSFEPPEHPEEDEAADAEANDRKRQRIDLGQADLDDAVIERPDRDGAQQQDIRRWSADQGSRHPPHDHPRSRGPSLAATGTQIRRVPRGWAVDRSRSPRRVPSNRERRVHGVERGRSSHGATRSPDDELHGQDDAFRCGASSAQALGQQFDRLLAGLEDR